MGKRQKRIFAKDLNEKLPDLLNLELNLILKNDVTLHGKITKLENQHFTFQDSVQRKHHLRIVEIGEIILDEISLY
jgi:hypothetical protein